MLWVVGIIIMMMDHIGAYLLDPPLALYFRLIGRIGLPIWPYLVARGAMRTKNIEEYLIRFCILAVVSEVPYVLVSGQFGNPMGALLVGLIGIKAIEQRSKVQMMVAGVVGIAVGMLGGYVPFMIAPVVMWLVLRVEWQEETAILVGGLLCMAVMMIEGPWVQIIGLMGLPLIAMEDRLGRIHLPKMVKYGVYPGHLVGILGVRGVLSMWG